MVRSKFKGHLNHPYNSRLTDWKKPINFFLDNGEALFLNRQAQTTVLITP